MSKYPLKCATARAAGVHVLPDSYHPHCEYVHRKSPITDVSHVYHLSPIKLRSEKRPSPLQSGYLEGQKGMCSVMNIIVMRCHCQATYLCCYLHCLLSYRFVANDQHFAAFNIHISYFTSNVRYVNEMQIICIGVGGMFDWSF